MFSVAWTGSGVGDALGEAEGEAVGAADGLKVSWGSNTNPPVADMVQPGTM
jgi:hypothetical protein